ncbi:MAG TPA: iron-sulfur cluster repair di-iron protein, ric [Bacillota bacterium]|nr:iron-sulfur cluster repair di-iron protein, ric [Bacillota bacterium]
MKKLNFEQAIKENLPTLEQYVPIVARVHGGSHPEFHKVHDLFKEITKKTKETASEKPDLDEVFTRLREVTDNYTVPGDVCESYEAVYNMLAVVDKAYRE